MEWFNIVASAIFFIFSSIGMILNVFVFLILCFYYGKLQPNSYYTFAIQLLLCDIFEFFVQFTAHVPIPLMSYLSSREYQQQPVFAYFTAVDHLARYAQLNLTLALCLNLLIGVCSKNRTTQKYYCGGYSYFLLLVVWLFTGGIVIVTYFLNCKRLFDMELFSLVTQCDTTDARARLFYLFLSIFFVAVLIVEAFVILFGHAKITLRRNKQKGTVGSDGGSKMYPTMNQVLPTRRSRVTRQRQLLNQATLLVLVYVIDVGLFLYGPFVPQVIQMSMYFRLLSIAKNTLQILCYTSRPLILFYFDAETNSRVNKVLKELFRKNYCKQK